MVTPEEIRIELDRAKENLRDVFKSRSEAFVFLRRFDLFFGVIIGVTGNALVSYYIEWQLYRLSISESLISENFFKLNFAIVGIFIIFLTIYYARSSGKFLGLAFEYDEFEKEFEDMIEGYEELLRAREALVS